MWQNRLWRSKVILLISSLVALFFLILAAIEEHTEQWRVYQEDFAKALAVKARASGRGAVDFPIEVRQAYLEDLDLERVDRCTTCHVGIDNPDSRDAPQPLKTHPGNLLKDHPADKFGCTICHQGQGRAIEKDAAHGRVAYWNEPLLIGDFVQATCTKCHHDEPIPQTPVLTRGRRLMRERGCLGCHRAEEFAAEEKVGPRLDAIGSKVSRKWLNKWLVDPTVYLPKARMPFYGLTPQAADALAAYLMTFGNATIDQMPDREGDYDAGATVYREAQCIVCHVTREDSEGNPVGGSIGPDLRKIGNKVNKRWLVAFFENPHAFLPNTKMPRYHFSAKQTLDLAQFVTEEWVDYDLRDTQAAEPEPPPDTPERIEQGKRLFVELGCDGCHALRGVQVNPTAPDLSFIGSRSVHDLDFGPAKVRRSVADFLYTKLKSPHALRSDYELPPRTSAAEAIWRNLKPAAMFSESEQLPSGSEEDRLLWILHQAQHTGLLAADLTLPVKAAAAQADWLVEQLNKVGALTPLHMPDFRLSAEDAMALTIALMSLTEHGVVSRRYEVPARPKVVFNPKDEFGVLERRYRCLSCHQIRESGDLLASDLTLEGSRVKRDWLYHFLNKPYSMRRTLTIAMPIFHFPDEESRLMADYMSEVFVDSQIAADWASTRAEGDAEHGKALFDEKGCIACHQLHGTGGDVGPSLTTQVPEFPQGTWVGDKLKGGWIYRWLKNPQALLPETIEPNLGLTDQQALDLTAFLLSLRNPEFQDKKKQ